ncbi:hypothetical protein GCM10029964_090720 [Kibdelosporangium lantanae]
MLRANVSLGQYSDRVGHSEDGEIDGLYRDDDGGGDSRYRRRVARYLHMRRGVGSLDEMVV